MMVLSVSHREIPAYAGMTVGVAPATCYAVRDSRLRGNDGRGGGQPDHPILQQVQDERKGGRAFRVGAPLRHIGLGDLAVHYGLVGGVIDGVLFVWGQAEGGKDRGVNLAAGVGQGQAETAFGAPVAGD